MKSARFNEVRYEIDLEPHDASCDHPQNKGLPMIRLSNGLKNNKQTLELLIHESLHACNWHASEEKVIMTSRDIARFLWRLGYRIK